MTETPKTVNIVMLKNFVTIKRQKKVMEDKAKALGKQADALMSQLIDEFVETETKSMRVDVGGIMATVTLGEKVFAHIITPEIPEDCPAEKADAIKAEARRKTVERLARSKVFKHLVKKDINLTSLTSLIKELRRDKKDIPKSLQGFVEANPVPDLIVTK